MILAGLYQPGGKILRTFFHGRKPPVFADAAPVPLGNPPAFRGCYAPGIASLRSCRLLIHGLLGAMLLFPALAEAGTYAFDFAGPGVSGHIDLAYGTTADATYPQAFEVTGISGRITDTNNGLTIVNATITGLAPLNVTAPQPTNLLAPANFSEFSIAAGSAYGDYSYDNLFWPGGSVQTATNYPPHGGFLDIYGLLFTISGGYTVNFWSNGDTGRGVKYGIGIATAAQQYDYVVGGVEVSVPEIDPAACGGALAMLRGSLGLRERRARRQGEPATTA